MKHTKQYIVSLICLFFSASVVADNVISGSVPVLASDEVFDASLEVVRGEKNKTLHVYSVSKQGQRKEIITEKGVQSFIIRNAGKFLFYRTYAGRAQWPEVLCCDGIAGNIVSMGNLPDYDVSEDGKKLFTYIARTEEQTIGVGILTDVVTMRELARYDFPKELVKKYGRTTHIGFFAIDIFYNDELNGFELLFDQYEEIGKLTCTGIISLDDYKFRFTDRKKELLKIMGY